MRKNVGKKLGLNPGGERENLNDIVKKGKREAPLLSVDKGDYDS